MLAKKIVSTQSQSTKRQFAESAQGQACMRLTQRLRDVFTPLCQTLRDRIHHESRTECPFDDPENFGDRFPATDIYRNDYVEVYERPVDHRNSLYALIHGNYADDCEFILRLEPNDNRIPPRLRGDWGKRYSYDELKGLTRDEIRGLIPLLCFNLSPARGVSPEYLDEFAQAIYTELLTRPEPPYITNHSLFEDFLSLASYMRSNTKHFDEDYPFARAEFGSFVWLPLNAPISGRYAVLRRLVAPVGPYGESFSKRLLTTAARMLRASTSLDEEAAQICSHHHELIAQTARGQEEINFRTSRVAAIDTGENSILSDAPLATLQEGIRSLTDVISLLMANRISAYENPETFLSDLIEAGLPAKLAMIVPPGFVGPAIFRGRYVPDIVSVTGAGTIGLSGSFLRHIGRSRMEMIHELILKHQRRAVGALGFGCPVAHKPQPNHPSGIQMLSEAFLTLFCCGT